MPVDSKSIEYENREKDWGKVEVVKAGDEAIKDAGEIYLPMLGGQSQKEYNRYKERGTFFNATARTIEALTGAVMRKDPVVTVPSLIEELLTNVTLSGLSFNDVVRLCVNNMISYGFYGILTDVPVELSERPYMALYGAVDILNWRTTKIGGQDVLSLLVLNESVEKESPKDPFVVEADTQIRVFTLEEGGLVVRLYQEIDVGKKGKEGWVMVDILPGVVDMHPMAKGKRLERIPFEFFGAMSNEPSPPRPPLLDLINLNIKHWQVSTDYYHGLHYCALPTPWAAGWPAGTDLYIGPGKAWISEDPNASAGFLEFTGQGLQAVEKALDRLENQMAVLGARMLERQKAGVEAAEALWIRASEDVATLNTIVGSAENGLANVLDSMLSWMGGTEESSEVRLNRDFVSERLSPQEVTVLLQAVQAGKLSQDTFLYNLQMGEILPKGRTIDEEKDLIESEGIEPFDEEEEKSEEEEEEVGG